MLLSYRVSVVHWSNRSMVSRSGKAADNACSGRFHLDLPGEVLLLAASCLTLLSYLRELGSWLCYGHLFPPCSSLLPCPTHVPGMCFTQQTFLVVQGCAVPVALQNSLPPFAYDDAVIDIAVTRSEEGSSLKPEEPSGHRALHAIVAAEAPVFGFAFHIHSLQNEPG